MGLKSLRSCFPELENSISDLFEAQWQTFGIVCSFDFATAYNLGMTADFLLMVGHICKDLVQAHTISQMMVFGNVRTLCLLAVITSIDSHNQPDDLRYLLSIHD